MLGGVKRDCRVHSNVTILVGSDMTGIASGTSRSPSSGEATASALPSRVTASRTFRYMAIWESVWMVSIAVSCVSKTVSAITSEGEI